MLNFAWPWLFLLLPLPWLVRRFIPAVELQFNGAVRLPFFAQWKSIQNLNKPTDQDTRNKSMLLIFAWICLVVAAARPQLLGEPVQLPLKGRDLLVALDLSGSMERADFIVNGDLVDRLTAVKSVLMDFFEQRQGDRIGLILFGQRAYVQTPLTFDLDTIKVMLQESEIGLAGQETAIGDAIGLSIKRLIRPGLKDRVLILVTDGANTAGQVAPLDAANMAKQQGIKIYTIGVGADKMQVSTLFGARIVNPSSDLDEETLSAIAENTGGKYFRAKDTESLEKISNELDKLEPIERDSRSFRPKTDLFYWPMSLALVLLLLNIVAITRPSRLSALRGKESSRG